MSKNLANETARLYFAYGSNINLDQMAMRCPNAEVVAPVTLNGYRLLFRGNSSSYGVATIAPDPVHQVKGLLWKLTPECERSLDRYEGYPTFYEKQNISVMDKAGNAYTVMAYIMTREYERCPSFPSMSYYTGIADGYMQNKIPLKGLKEALRYSRDEVAAFERQLALSSHNRKDGFER